MPLPVIVKENVFHNAFLLKHGGYIIRESIWNILVENRVVFARRRCDTKALLLLNDILIPSTLNPPHLIVSSAQNLPFGVLFYLALELLVKV